MTVKTTKNDDGVIELDLGKIAPFGVIPLIVIAVILLIQAINTNRDNKELRQEIKIIRESVDTANMKIDRLTKLSCAKDTTTLIKLLDIKCP